jgi:arylsulfatase A-like enzyme
LLCAGELHGRARRADHRVDPDAHRADYCGDAGRAAGIQPEDPTLGDLLKAQGYRTAQIGKNHLGDRNEFLPTVHGFGEFYGNLYHLNSRATLRGFADRSPGTGRTRRNGVMSS